MSRTNGRRTDKSSYSNPKSKARSRKEYSKKIDNKQYQSSTKQTNKKSVNNENKKVKVKMSSTYGKVCKKLPEAKTIINTDHFEKLYIEIPVVMKWYHRLSKKSTQLIINFFEVNPWALEIFRQKYNGHFVEKFKHTDENLKCMLKSLIKHNFNHKRFCTKKFLDIDITVRDVFFRKKDSANGKKEWTFVMNLADLYDSYAAYYKQQHGNIPYSIEINHLIYKNTDHRKETNVGNYGFVNSRFVFTYANLHEYIPHPIPANLGIRYVLYINDKNKRKAMDKKYDYVEHQFNKVVIKEIPLISTPVSTKRR
jgi:hypothetical protein